MTKYSKNWANRKKNFLATTTTKLFLGSRAKRSSRSKRKRNAWTLNCLATSTTSHPTQNQTKSQILFHENSSLCNLCTMTLFSDGREVSIRSQIEWWRPNAIRMMCTGGSCILILDRDDNGIELEVLFFPIYFSEWHTLMVMV